MSRPPPPDEIAPKLDTGTRLAFERTFLAYERTLLAWIRTAVSLISFGFTIHKFFQAEEGRTGPAHPLVGPAEFSIAMVIIGLAALPLALVAYRQNLRPLRALDPEIPRSFGGVYAGLIGVLGILALIEMLLRR